jgi:hypothetical protein
MSSVLGRQTAPEPDVSAKSAALQTDYKESTMDKVNSIDSLLGSNPNA